MRLLLLFMLLAAQTFAQSNTHLYTQRQRWENAIFQGTKNDEIICFTEIQSNSAEFNLNQQSQFLQSIYLTEGMIDVNFLADGIIQFYHFHNLNYDSLGSLIIPYSSDFYLVITKIYTKEELQELYMNKH